MKVAPKETKKNSQTSLNRKFRVDSARFREPVIKNNDNLEVPVLSDSLLRRIDYARHLNNQNSKIQNLPLLPILKYETTRRVLSSSKSGRQQSSGSTRQLNSASRFGKTAAAQPKKLPKSTKITAFNNSTLTSANLKLVENNSQPHGNSSLSLSSTNSVVSGGNDSSHSKDLHSKENFHSDDIYHGKNYQSNQFLNSNQSNQSNLLRSLKNDTENSSTAEIIVRPIPLKNNRYEEGINKKIPTQNINLAPLIKNFRLNSFDFHGEFNVEKYNKNTKILKPLNDFNLKSDSKMSNKNLEIANRSNQAKVVNSKQSINYLAAGILNAKAGQTINSSNLVSLNRKLDLDDFEYYDVQELFKKNYGLKSGYFRKKLSQINEESTIDGTPLSNSRWSSSLSNFSGKTIKYDPDDIDNDIWSDIDDNHLPIINPERKKSALPLVVDG